MGPILLANLRQIRSHIMFKTAFTLGDKDGLILATINTEDSLTNQSDAQEADINILVKKFGITGQLPQVTGLQPLYGDFTSADDYRTSLDKINAAKEAFQAIPAHIRKQFDNDPAKFIQFASDEKNIEKLREWKLAPPKEAPKDGERKTDSTDTA